MSTPISGSVDTPLYQHPPVLSQHASPACKLHARIPRSEPQAVIHEHSEQQGPMKMSFNTRATQEVTPSYSCAHYAALVVQCSVYAVYFLCVNCGRSFCGTDWYRPCVRVPVLSTNTVSTPVFPCQLLLCRHLFRCLHSCYLTRIRVPTLKHRPSGPDVVLVAQLLQT